MSREKSGGISVTTLLIASASAAAAAIVVPLLWAGGGVVAAAITPVIVTLVSESLKHPVTKVQEAGVWRRTPQGTAVRQPAGRDFDPVDPEEERIEVAPGAADDPFGLYEEESGFFTKRKVVIALVTGAIAFGIAAVIVTAGELTVGGSTTPSKTTFFGGSRATATPTATPSATPKPGATPTPTPTATTTGTPTATLSAQATPTPSASAAPNAASPATQATPAPTP
jgi:hypothetical protein